MNISSRLTTSLLYISLLFLLVGSALNILHWVWTDVMFIIGAIGMISYFLYTSTIIAKDNARERRLNRMGFIGSLGYIVSGGFMYDDNRIWVILFAISSIYVMYSLLAKRQ